MNEKIVTIIETLTKDFVVRVDSDGIQFVTFKYGGQVYNSYMTGYTTRPDGSLVGRFDSISGLKGLLK